VNRRGGEPVILLTHSMSGASGWVLLERLGDLIKAVVAVAPAPPGNVQPEGVVFSETETALEVEAMGRRQTVSKTGESSRDPDWVSNKLVGNSLFFPRALIPAYGASLLKMGFRLQYERMNLRGSQLKVADTAKMKGRPVLVVTGDRDRDHSREIDGAIVDWLRDCGAAVDFYWLPDRGIEGNGHMMMLETNADATASIIQEWIEAR
jgi:pimeloyl-ACP methyl ester carboxylesterase